MADAQINAGPLKWFVWGREILVPFLKVQTKSALTFLFVSFQLATVVDTLINAVPMDEFE